MKSLSLEAIGVFVGAGLWAARYEHADLPVQLPQLLGTTKRTLAELVSSGLWSQPGTGYRTLMPAELRRTRDGCRGRIMLVSHLMTNCMETLYAGYAGLGLWALTASWSLTTDDPGFIPYDAARRFGTPETINALTDSTLWLEHVGGYMMAVSDHPLEVYWALGRDDERAPIPPEVRKRVYERDGWACVFCGISADLTVDHIYPWSLGGSDDDGNLQTACRSCNASKGARI